MNPLYIASTNTILRSPRERYVHPITGETYGGTDYDNAAKLAEIGAVPLREEAPAAGFTAAAWEIVAERGGYLRRPAAVAAIPAPAAEEQVAQIKATAEELLAQTDKIALRNVERFLLRTFPDWPDRALADEREAIRAESNAAEVSVIAAALER